jgi:hypothetical protein
MNFTLSKKGAGDSLERSETGRRGIRITKYIPPIPEPQSPPVHIQDNS